MKIYQATRGTEEIPLANVHRSPNDDQLETQLANRPKRGATKSIVMPLNQKPQLQRQRTSLREGRGV